MSTDLRSRNWPHNNSENKLIHVPVCAYVVVLFSLEILPQNCKKHIQIKFVVRVIILVDIVSVPEEMLLLVEFIFQGENLMRQTIQFESFLLNLLSVLEGQNRVKVSNNQATQTTS